MRIDARAFDQGSTADVVVHVLRGGARAQRHRLGAVERDVVRAPRPAAMTRVTCGELHVTWIRPLRGFKFEREVHVG